MRELQVVVSNEELRVLQKFRRKLAARMAKNVHRADEEAHVLYRVLGDVVKKGEQQDS